jgi:hypothetical protein
VGIMERLRFGSRAWAKTIAIVEPSRLKNVGLTPQAPRLVGESLEDVCRDTFKIRLAHDASRTAEARFLVDKQYGKKGYRTMRGSVAKDICPESVTLATYRGDEMMGTLTVGFDVGNGLLVDELYKAEVDLLRQEGRRVCEFTKLAIDNKRTSKRVLAGLFHVAFFYAERIWGYSDIVIEVNPTHVSFYQRLLGFEVIGAERMCPRVHAPAVLLRVDTGWVRNMVRQYGGHPELAKEERSLYPYFLPQVEEDKIVDRLMRG